MLRTVIKEDRGMPATFDAIRNSLRVCCIALVPLFAACGGGGGGGGGAPGGAVAAACGTATPVAFPSPAPAPGTPPPGIALSLQQVNTGFALSAPLYVTAPPGEPADNGRIFVVERGGLIKVVNRSTNTLIGTFLDLSGVIFPPSDEDERGLFSLAFDPGYRTNGRFYVSYIDANDNAVVVRHLVSGNPETSNVAIQQADRVILSTPYQGAGTLFGGLITFRDGLLYVGRGSSGTDSGANAQNVGVMLGKLLRIDVSNATQAPEPAYAIPSDNPCVGQAGARPEIYSIGLRNPWRFSFDRANGDIYIADVGGSDFEEVNVSTMANRAGRGANFGWRITEGTHCFAEPGQPEPQCDRTGLQQPILDYPHITDNCTSVTGGYVYRGSVIANLQGTYFYGDACRGFVRSFRMVNNAVTEHATWFTDLGHITSFGEDNQGELYITTAEGALFRIQ
jgi:glucose/arabinose dehydrogenase